MIDTHPESDAATSPSTIAAEAVSQAFLRNYPKDAARKLESMDPADAADLLARHSSAVRLRVWIQLTPTSAAQILKLVQDSLARELLSALDSGPCANLLARLDNDSQDRYLNILDPNIAAELRELIAYPDDCAGHMMDTKVLAMDYSISVAEALKRLKTFPLQARRRVFALDDDGRLYGQVTLENLISLDPNQPLKDVSTPVLATALALDPKTEVADKLQKDNLEMLPVIDSSQRLLGVIRGATAAEAVKEDIATDVQTMVGASRDEQALSSSFFAVRKRQPWLQINLLTGFLAAAVVGLFEDTISQFTALAVLMPVAAGQSGNTGAQALAVTMRGLTLREITARHWFRVMMKEAGAGLMNGVAIAITCGLGVLVWSDSGGLAVVIAMAMVISMTIAGIAGALVPIVLKKLGQDPAQSSSIILTTVTDIAGFMSFLGIATALSGFLA